MAMAVAAFMCVGTASALAGKTPPSKPQCKHGVDKSGKCKPKPCEHGKDKSGKCKPKPHPKPNPPQCEHGKDDKGHCKPPPIIVHPPSHGPCSKADLVLLEDLIKGSGALLCLYLGENSQNATDGKDCPDALLALPVDSLIGACLFLPPADVGDHAGADDAFSGLTGLTGTTGLPSLPGLPNDQGALASSGLQDLMSMITGLFDRATAARS
jgi:hypothetical protein